jgi:hypothetical protein
MVIQTLGTSPTPPIVAITGPLNSWEIYNATTNTSVKAVSGSGANIPAGSVLTFDYATATATLTTGSTSVSWYDKIDFVTTSWGSLAAGPNDLRIFGSGSSSGSTAYRVDWRDAWY